MDEALIKLEIRQEAFIPDFCLTTKIVNLLQLDL